MSTPEHDGEPSPSPWAAPSDPTETASSHDAGAAPVWPGQPALLGEPAQPGEPGHPGYPGYPAAPGYPPPGYGPWPGHPVLVRSTNGMAIASLVLAVAGLGFCGAPALVGAILGHVARRQIRRTGEDGAGLALAGIITGWTVFGLMVLIGAAYVGFIGFMIAHTPMNDGDFPTPEPYPS